MRRNVTRDELFEQFKRNGTEEANFVIQREDRAGRYFSEAALDSLFDQITALVAANIMRGDKPPHTLKVEMKVTTED